MYRLYRAAGANKTGRVVSPRPGTPGRGVGGEGDGLHCVAFRTHHGHPCCAHPTSEWIALRCISHTPPPHPRLGRVGERAGGEGNGLHCVAFRTHHGHPCCAPPTSEWIALRCM